MGDEEIEVGSRYFLFVVYLIDVHAVPSVDFDARDLCDDLITSHNIMSPIHAITSDVAGLHNFGMIGAQKDHYLIQTLPSFSVSFFNMGFSATSCVIPTAIP